MNNAAIEQEIHQQLELLPLHGQRQVLEFARTLVSNPRGVPGKDYLSLAGMISAPDLAVIAEAVNDGCEQIDEDGW